VRAEGGLILISANSANALRESVIKNTGTLSAPTLSEVGGRIILDAGPRGTADLSGQITARAEAPSAKGGSVVATGEHLILHSDLVVDASGQASGGSVLVGGGWQGAGDTRQATTVTMESGSKIDVSSKVNGDGGVAVLWSQVSNPDSQTIVKGTIDASAGPLAGAGGKVETSGHLLDIRQARVTTASPQGKAGTWLIDPTDLTIDSATASTISTALSGGTSVESQADRDITLDTNVSIVKSSGADTTLTISAGRDITLNSGSSIQSTSGKLDTVLRAGHLAGLPLSSGAVTLNSNSSIVTLGGNVEISGSRFTNNSGNNAFNVGTGGRWQVWSRNNDPFNASAAIGDTAGGLVFDYKQYNATLGTTAPLGTGSAFLYSYAPVLTVTLTGSSSRAYDGTTTAALSASNFNTLGAVGADTGINLTLPSTGTYATKNVGSNVQVTASNLALQGVSSSAATGSKPVYGYTLSSSTVSGAIGTVTPKTVELSATKTYDGTTALSAGQVTIQTGVANESLVAAGASASDSHVATTGKYIQSITLANGTGGVASNYQLPTLDSTNAAVTITPATLTPTLTNSGVTKAYDGTTNAPTGFTPTYSFTGLVSGDTSATLGQTATALDNAHAGQATTLTVSGLSLTGITGNKNSASTDYTLSTTTQSVAASVTPKVLTATASIGGTTAAPDASVTGSVIGAVTGDTLSLNTSGITLAYNNKHVVGANAIVATGTSTLTISSTVSSVAGDYSFTAPTIANANATITPKALTATAAIGGTVTKTYDGTTAATGASVTGTVTGAVNGDTLGLNTSGITLAYNNAHVAAANKITATGTAALAINASTAGSVLTDYSFTAPTVADATASITAKALTTTATIGGTLTKTYDGTTSATGATLSSSVSGAVSGDTLSLNTSGITLAYNSAHVGSATKVVASGSGSLTIASSGSNSELADYSFTAPTITDASATITPKALTATASIGGTLTKTYDGTSATGASVSGSVSGAVAGDTLSLNTAGISLAYNNAHVALANKITASGSAALSIGASTANSVAGDYSFTAPTIADATATITPKALTATASIGGSLTKVYDGTTAATGASVSGSVSGAINGDTLSLNTSTITLAYNNAHVAGANAIVASGSSSLTIGSSTANSVAGDYSFTAPTISNATASITPATLSPTLTNTGVTKVYDGTTAAPSGFAPSYSVTGLVSGDTAVSLNNTGSAFNNAHVAQANKVTVAGLSVLSVTGTRSSAPGDYQLDHHSQHWWYAHQNL
jgi:hypothetical protein